MYGGLHTCVCFDLKGLQLKDTITMIQNRVSQLRQLACPSLAGFVILLLHSLCDQGNRRTEELEG